MKALYLQATVGDINTARPVRERQGGAGGQGDGQQGQGGEGGGGAQHGQAAEAAAGGLQGGAQTEGSGQAEVPRAEKPVLRPAPSMHTASLQATIAGTLQDFMVLARDDQLDLFSYRGEKLDRLGSGPLPSCHTTIASRGDLLAVSYDKTVILLKVEQVDETEKLVQHLGKLTFDANVRELGWGPGGRLEIVTSNVVIGYSGEFFHVIDYVIQSDENNIVSAAVLLARGTAACLLGALAAYIVQPAPGALLVAEESPLEMLLGKVLLAAWLEADIMAPDLQHSTLPGALFGCLTRTEPYSELAST